MSREYVFKTERLVFSEWTEEDLPLAQKLWGNEKVTRFICAGRVMSDEQIVSRLKQEIENDQKFQTQYWPIFSLKTGELVGCCGLRPYGKDQYQLGFHLLPEFWKKGYAIEAASVVTDYAFGTLEAEYLFAGHHPDNKASARVLKKLGFCFVGDEFYEPTGLYHPSYLLVQA